MAATYYMAVVYLEANQTLLDIDPKVECKAKSFLNKLSA